MINLKSIKQIYEGCGFEHALLRKPVREREGSAPRNDTLDKVARCIRMHKKITRLGISKKINISFPTLRRCLTFLVDSGEIVKDFKTDSGPQALRTYSSLGKLK